MVNIIPTVKDISRNGDQSTLRITWALVTESDVCLPISYPGYSDKSIHVYGTFGGASVALQGSNNNGASFASLNDPSSTVIAITSEKIKAVLEDTEQFKPLITGGTAQSLSIAVFARINNPMRQ